MKFTNYLLGLFFISVVFTSCGGDDVECTDAGLNEAIQEETMALEEALSTYFLDPENTEACENLKDAYDAFLDQAKELQDCADELGDGEEYMNSIQDAEDALDLLEC